MLPYPMRCLLLSSCLFSMLSCSPVYKNWPAVSGNAQGLQKFRPVIKVALYRTKVDVVGNHLSGLLMIKKMPDSSTRIVFSNEMGFKFFDFEFASNGDFKVYSIIKQMDKKPVITTLRKDFELVLMERLDSADVSIRKNNELLYYVFPQQKGFYYYITDSSSNHLIRMERASKRKTVVEATTQNYSSGIPDSIYVSHTKFNFTISLKRIVQ